MGRNEDGKGRCPFDPAQSYTSVMVGKYTVQQFYSLNKIRKIYMFV